MCFGEPDNLTKIGNQIKFSFRVPNIDKDVSKLGFPNVRSEPGTT